MNITKKLQILQSVYATHHCVVAFQLRRELHISFRTERVSLKREQG